MSVGNKPMKILSLQKLIFPLGAALLAAATILPLADSAAQSAAVAPTVAAPSTAPALPPPAATPPPRTPESAVTPVNRNPKRHAQFLYRITEGEVGLLFVGDSITDGWPRGGEWSWLKFAPYHPADFGVSGERTEDVLWRLENGELEGIDPKAVVLMIGTNNIGQISDEKPEWVAAGIQKIVETLHAKLPKTKVLLLGVFPRGTKDSPQRARVSSINPLIAKLDDGAKTRYLDIGHVFLDEKGEIPADIMPDKLHPNAKGYDLWYDAIRSLLEEMLK
jgi:lysophospholipase L1-like esterase